MSVRGRATNVVAGLMGRPLDMSLLVHGPKELEDG